jgi:hypothetical protein
LLAFIPSPQVDMHVCAEELLPPIHQYPTSIVIQSLEHPSPFMVFPSSHWSEEAKKYLLSPQISVQTDGLLFTQLHPASTTQLEDHPSLSTILPSSHVSREIIKLSPQTTEQTEGSPVQEYPVSTAQVLSQPSPLMRLLSSHPSVPVTLPSPHF